MGEILIMEEIEQKFDGEWVLIEDVETDEKLEVVRGKVVFHGKDKDALHEIEMKSKSNHLATLYIGGIDPKMEFVLNF